MKRLTPPRPLAACLLLALLSGCGNLTDAQKALGTFGTGILGVTPSSELQQTYYLGVFDPQDQLPPTLYRVRVKGQASPLNFTQYASGWLPAEVADSLTGAPRFQADGKLGAFERVEGGGGTFETGRRLVMFGPDGFREAPRNYRLVIVMGSDPQKFFQGVQEALGTVAAATQGSGGAQFEREIFQELLKLHADRDKFFNLLLDTQGATQ